jgi:hypothetical protein
MPHGMQQGRGQEADSQVTSSRPSTQQHAYVPLVVGSTRQNHMPCVCACRLESRGPSWQNPGIMDVLRSIPCLTAAPEELLLWLRAYGELRSYQPGQCIIPRRVRVAMIVCSRCGS